jgi:iron complex outermembrane receptor protein
LMTLVYKNYALSFLFCIGFSFQAVAQTVSQNSDSLSEEEFYGDIPVVLTATRLAQPINEAPASMTIIDRQMIEASGAREVADVFRLVPGFMVQHENGHTPIVTYHGMSDQYSRRLQVLVDGRSIYNPSIGGVEWSQIPLVLDDIERIEVTRGPNAASFGSNAFSATINIITKHSSDTPGTSFRYTAGKPNKASDGVLQYGDSSGDLSYRFTLGRLSDDGFPNRYDIMRANLGRLRMDFSKDAKNRWLFEMGFNNGPRGLDFLDSNDKAIPERDREKIINYNFQQLKWTHNISNKQELYIQYFHNFHKVHEINSFNLTAQELGLPTPNPAYDANPINATLFNSLRTDRHDLEIQHTLVPNDKWRVVWGGSIRRDLFYSPGLINSTKTEKIDLSRVFANTEWRATSKFTINAGAMWEDSRLTGTSLSPRLGLLYKLDGHHNLRLVSSRATRIPTIIEYDGNIIYHYSSSSPTAYGPPYPSNDYFLRGTKNLNNEIINSREIGINSNYPDIGLSTDIKVFQDKISNIVFFGTVIDPTVDDNPLTGNSFAVPKNGEDVTVHGLEIQADTRPYKGGRIIFSYANTLIDSKNIYEKYSDTAPVDNFSMLFMHKFSNALLASFAMYQTSSYEGLGSGNPIGNQNRADVRLAIPFHKDRFSGEIALVAQNISGLTYLDWSRANTMGGRELITISGHIE